MRHDEDYRLGELLSYLSPWPATVRTLADDMGVSTASIYRLIEFANYKGHDIVLNNGRVLVTSGAGFKRAWQVGIDWWNANVGELGPSPDRARASGDAERVRF